MRKIYIIAFLCVSYGAFAQQQNMLLQKYRGMALEYNHNLKAAEKNITASMELEKMARADKGPKVSAGATYQYTGNPMSLSLNLPSVETPISFGGPNNQYGAAVSLSQPLYTGGRILEAIRMSKYQQSMAMSQSEFLRLSVCFQTDIQYWSTVARYEMVEVATELRNSMATLVKTIKERVEAGLVDPQDLLMAEVKLNEAEYQLLQARNAFEVGRMALNSMIGAELQQLTEVEQIVPVVIVPDSLFHTNGNLRPEIKIAQERVNLAGSHLKLNDSKYKPQLYVGAEGSYSSPGYNFKSDLDPNYAVYAKLSVPIFEWGKRRSEKRMSKQQIGMETDNLNQVTDDVNLEINTAKTALNQALQQVELAFSSLEKARENERKAFERYKEGKISILEIIDAQAYRQTSQVNYTQAKVSAQSNYSQLIKALNKFDLQ